MASGRVRLLALAIILACLFCAVLAQQDVGFNEIDVVDADQGEQVRDGGEDGVLDAIHVPCLWGAGGDQAQSRPVEGIREREVDMTDRRLV